MVHVLCIAMTLSFAEKKSEAQCEIDWRFPMGTVFNKLLTSFVEYGYGIEGCFLQLQRVEAYRSSAKMLLIKKY